MSGQIDGTITVSFHFRGTAQDLGIVIQDIQDLILAGCSCVEQEEITFVDATPPEDIVWYALQNTRPTSQGKREYWYSTFFPTPERAEYHRTYLGQHTYDRDEYQVVPIKHSEIARYSWILPPVNPALSPEKDRPLSEILLTTDAERLMGKGLHTSGELAACRENLLRQMRCIGPKFIERIRASLGTLDLTLAD